MAADKKSWVMYDSWIPLFESLPKESATDLFLAICQYRKDRNYSPDDPMIAAMFNMIKLTMDEDERKYKEMCEKRAAWGKEGAEAKASTSKQKKAKASISKDKSANEAEKEKDKESDKDKEKDKDSEEDKKPKRTQASLVGESSLSDPLKDKLMEWLAYKKERKDKYGETGLKSLITQACKHEQESGSEAVIDLINECMANGWAGIIWDKLKQAPRNQTVRNGTMNNNESWVAAYEEVMNDRERDNTDFNGNQYNVPAF